MKLWRDTEMAKLNGEEIVAIIRAGHESKVAKLELGTVKITYLIGLEAENFHQPETTQIIPYPTADVPVSHDKSLQQELDEQLICVTDPVAYERMQFIDEKA
jgi:hypothetical protein